MSLIHYTIDIFPSIILFQLKIPNTNPKQQFRQKADLFPAHCSCDGLRGRLIKNKVYVSQWWKYLLELLPADSVEADYSRYLLPLPIDQRYTPDDMRALAALVLQLKEEGEPA